MKRRIITLALALCMACTILLVSAVPADAEDLTARGSWGGGRVPAIAIGDADGNGAVDFFDGMLILQFYAGLINETQLYVSAADVDNSGDVSFFDGMYVLQYYAGILDKLPVE